MEVQRERERDDFEEDFTYQPRSCLYYKVADVGDDMAAAAVSVVLTD